MDMLSIDAVLPNEMFYKIFSFLDLDAFRNVRLVSKKWKSLLVDGHSTIHVVVPISDDNTLDTINNLTETKISLHVYEFTEKFNENEVVATAGTGLLFGQAENVKFTCDHIAPAEIQKRLPYAISNVRMLSFVNIRDDVIIRPFLEMTNTFSALRKLEIGFIFVGGRDDAPNGYPTIAHCYMSILQRLAALDSGPQMPLLESLKIFSTGGATLIIPTIEMFPNILAIAKLILKFRRTLKEVEVACNYVGDFYHARTPGVMLSPEQQNEQQEFLDAFKELVNLKRIRYSSVHVRDNPLDWELQLLRTPKYLTELLLRKFVSRGSIPDLSRLFPENGQMLTTIKMDFTFTLGRNDGPVNFAVFGQCPNLKTLWLDFYQHRSRQPLSVTNVDQLSSTMTSLHLKSNWAQELPWRRQYVILTREQLRWVVNNLMNLESFWTQLVFQSTGNQNAAGDANNNDAPQQPQEEVASSPSNIDVEVFRDMMSMPKLRDLKLDLMKASNLSEQVLLDDVLEYMKINVAGATTTCHTFSYADRAQNISAYVEFTVQIDRFFTSS